MTTYNIPASSAGEPQQKSLGELFGDLTRETATLVRQEVSLAQAELTQKATKAGKDVGMIAAGGAVAYAGLIVLLIGIALALVAAGLAPWLAYILVGAVVAGVGGYFTMQGLSSLQKIDPVPHQTVETLKEDARWAKEQAK
jgi:fatty acid desaturase